MVDAAAATLAARRSWDGSEGPIPSLRLGPGVVQVRYRDASRAARTHERNAAGEALLKRDVLALEDRMVEDRFADALEAETAAVSLAKAGVSSWSAVEDAAAVVESYLLRSAGIAAGPKRWRRVTSWSRKSRANMRRTLAALDYAPLFAEGRIPAMITLTYPGDWLTVAPAPSVCKRHVDLLRKRYQRAWGHKLVAVWKREFQRRGAPHYHLFMTPPVGKSNGGRGLGFGEWLSQTWAAIVAHPDADERRRHVLAGTGINYGKGTRMSDPRRMATYFAKHGVYSAKDYQNDAPAEWADSGEGVGRFWGYWGLERAVSEVEVTEVEALAAARTMRRWQRANGYRVQRPVWRKVYRTTLDTTTGELVESWKWRKRNSGVRAGASMRGHRGFVLVNDAPSFVAKLSTHLHAVREAAQEAEIAALRASQAYVRWIAGPDPGGSLDW